MKHSLLLVLIAFIVSAIPANAQIKINEIVASNGSSYSDGNGEFDDWVEIYSAGEVSIDFGGCTFRMTLRSLTNGKYPPVKPAKP